MSEAELVVSRHMVFQQQSAHFILQVFQADAPINEFEIIVYNTKTHTHKKSVKQITAPNTWGIEEADMRIILAEAEALCEDFENDS